MTLPFDCRRDARGWTVFDRWTGRIVKLDGAAQIGLPYRTAEETMRRLNGARILGQRDILQ
jgi:hypothetical protein